MSDQTSFDALFKAGQDFAKSLGVGDGFSLDALEKLVPNFTGEQLELMMGKGMNPKGLDAKTRLLMTLMGLTIAGGEGEAQIRLTIKNAREVGAQQQEVLEAIGMAALFNGVAGSPKALKIATEIFAEDAP